MSTIPDSVHQDTLAARYAVNTDDNHGAVIPPLYMSSNFSFQGFGKKSGSTITPARVTPRVTNWQALWRPWKAGQGV